MYQTAEHARPIVTPRQAASAGRRPAALRGQAPTQAEFYRIVIAVMLLSVASVGAGVLVGLFTAFLRG